MKDEHTIWEGHPSHWQDLGFHLVCLLFCWLIVPIALSGWRFLSNHFSRYEITSERIRITSGVLSKRMEEMELYRVKDSTFEQPFRLRIFGLANLQIRTSDPSNPSILIPAIRDANAIRESLRRSVETMRERKGVREVDYR
jgi:uncharacterized membrane protein YdbT with pleckstrin-like domain